MSLIGHWVCFLHFVTIISTCRTSREKQTIQIWNEQTAWSNDTRFQVRKRLVPIVHDGSCCTKGQRKDDNFPLMPSQHFYFVKDAPKRENNHHSLFGDLYTILLRNIASIPDSYAKDKRKPKKEKIFIYGRDDRKPVTSMQLRQFPFFNVVRLSSGCTGTLITPSYVLTAAHCVHDGYKFKNNMEMLKIQVPHKTKYRTHYAKEITVPYLWSKSGEIPEVIRVAFDYAVVKLNIGVVGRHAFMPLHIPSNDDIRTTKLYFLGFPFHSDLLWKSKCPGWSSLVICKRNILLNKCDSTTGNSGSAIYTEKTWRRQYKIIGILSSTNTAKSQKSVTSRYTTFSLLTRSKIDDICTMISPEGSQYNVCPHYNNNRKVYNKVLYG